MVANIYLVGERGIFLQMTDVIGNRDTENDVVTRAHLENPHYAVILDQSSIGE